MTETGCKGASIEHHYYWSERVWSQARPESSSSMPACLSHGVSREEERRGSSGGRIELVRADRQRSAAAKALVAVARGAELR